MKALGLSRSELDLIIEFLNKSEARDKICRAIQYGSKFLSSGKPGTARNVEKSTSLARKVFRLFKFLIDFNLLISPVRKGTPLFIVILGKLNNALRSTFYFLDQFVWLGRSGIYKNKEQTEFISHISHIFRLGACICETALEIVELGRLSSSMKLKLLKNPQDDLYGAKLQRFKDRILALIKSSLNTITAIGVLAPKIVTPRVTGGLGFISSLISCYQLLPSRHKVKKP